MAKTISNLLVGIGFDLDKKSTNNVSSGIDSIKSKALKLGSIVAGAFGIKALTSDFASAKDDLFKFSQVFGSTADTINAFGNALRLEGGTLASFMSQLAGLEKFRAGLAVGDAGFIAAAGRAGLDTKALIEAKDATEGYLALADQFQRMTRQQRINAADALGLDEASIRLLSKGRSGIEAVVAQQRKMRPITEGMTAAAAQLNDEFQDLSTNIGGFADRISASAVPQINNIVKGMNDWIDANRNLMNMGVDTFLDNLLVTVPVLGLAYKLIYGSEDSPEKISSVKPGFMGAGAKGIIDRSDNVGDLTIPASTSLNAEDLTNPANIPARSPLNASSGFLQSETSQKPIVIHNTVEIDGQVIDKKVHKVVGEMADQAVQDLTSTEAG